MKKLKNIEIKLYILKVGGRYLSPDVNSINGWGSSSKKEEAIQFSKETALWIVKTSSQEVTKEEVVVKTIEEIDKTFLNKKESRLFFNWYNENQKKVTEFLGCEVFLYNSPEGFEGLSNNTDVLLLWSASEKLNVWLLNNCNVTAIQNRLTEQYDEEWIEESKSVINI